LHAFAEKFMLCLVMCHVLLQTCRRIRAAMAGSGLHIPIVMLTAQVGHVCSMPLTGLLLLRSGGYSYAG
jgi:CheY-like chemotaxis protein